MAQETIFALSSGPGPSGVAVIRISGPATRALVQKITGQAVPPARQAALRHFREPSTGAVIDSGLVLFFPGPRSFTGEDVAEFQLHGSLATIRGLSRILSHEPGVEMAAPGAFTQRAFLNGKMDLLAVEALGDLLAAETMEQARLAHRAQQGLRSAAAQWREDLLNLLALTEASIDFSDEDDVVRHLDSSAEQICDQLIASLEVALGGYAAGERIRRGFRIALCGAPNAGKSSLLNALARRDVALVSPLAGTTRDVIEVHLDLGGFPIIVSDTAGFRQSGDALENAGMERARAAADKADLVLWLSALDSPTVSDIADAMVVHTKADLIDSDSKRPQSRFVSVTTGVGLEALLEEIALIAQNAMTNDVDGLIVVRERQAAQLAQALEALKMARALPAERVELRAEDIRRALRCLDRLTGRIDHEEVLGAIFSRFCIGK